VFGKHLLELQRPGDALIQVIVARQVIERRALHLTSGDGHDEKGPRGATSSKSSSQENPAAEVEGVPLRNDARTEDSPRVDPMANFELGAFTQVIKVAGEDAVRTGSVDFLYRCQDALSYAGCTAVERNLYFLGKECARGLCHLGRVARAAELECFWDKCLLTPLDHSAEKLGHMLTWLISIPSGQRSIWISMFEEVFSRLHGHRCSLGIDESASPAQICLTQHRGQSHKISFSSSEGSRTVDFSDPQMQKDVDWL
jgi:hypothetical protein